MQHIWCNHHRCVMMDGADTQVHEQIYTLDKDGLGRRSRADLGAVLPTASAFTLMVSSMERNFLLSPISMALLISGTASFTASSMGTGGMFSPPAVMISSKHHAGRTDLATDQS